MQYKSIAGPIRLTIEGGGGYGDAVRKYASIINKEAVGGWKFCWMQQIPVIKKSPSISGILGLAFFAGVAGFFLGDGIGVAIVAAIAGGVLGYFIAKEEKIEIFNMLIFSNEESSGVSYVKHKTVEGTHTLIMKNDTANPQKPNVELIACEACGTKNAATAESCSDCGLHFV